MQEVAKQVGCWVLRLAMALCKSVLPAGRARHGGSPLNAFSNWGFLFSGILLYVSLPLGMAPNDGWFNYTPYALRTYDPGPNINFYASSIIFLGISTIAGTINFVVTMLRLRARASIALKGRIARSRHLP